MTCKSNCQTAPGSRTKLITIEKPKTTGFDANYGTHDLSSDASWEQHTKAYANVLTRGGREFFQASKVHADLSHLWEVASTAKTRSATPEMRLTWNDRTFQILSVLDKDEDRRTVEISTKEVV